MEPRRKSPIGHLGALPLLACALALGGCAYENLPPLETSSAGLTASPRSYTVRGTLRGLHGYGLVLQNNGGDDIAVGADGSFAFPEALPDGTGYDVTISLQPTSPVERCTVEYGAGTVAGADVEDVVVTCELAEFAVGGHVHGLDTFGLVLTKNGDEEIALAKDGMFVFYENVVLGAAYVVTVTRQPDGAFCDVKRGRGTMGTGGELDVEVSCATR